MELQQLGMLSIIHIDILSQNCQDFQYAFKSKDSGASFVILYNYIRGDTLDTDRAEFVY